LDVIVRRARVQWRRRTIYSYHVISCTAVVVIVVVVVVVVVLDGA
jgi:hypothetical protein